nr:MAG TPA: hypothetical protein [Caudoviricetes sp.]
MYPDSFGDLQLRLALQRTDTAKSGGNCTHKNLRKGLTQQKCCAIISMQQKCCIKQEGRSGAESGFKKRKNPCWAYTSTTCGILRISGSALSTV